MDDRFAWLYHLPLPLMCVPRGRGPLKASVLAEGVVLRAVCGIYSVHSDGRVIHCTLRGNLKKTLEYSTSAAVGRRVTRIRRHAGRDTLAIGDRVRFTEGAHGDGVIEDVLPRSSRFSRAGFRGREHTVVCNLDLVVVVFSCAEPNPDLWKLDRFLVAAEAEGMRSVIVANKTDLLPENPLGAFAEYVSVGYTVLGTCAHPPDGLQALRESVTGSISAFVGPSGTGKSSLLNALQPGLSLRTADIGHVTYKGRHTTTVAQLIPLRFGGWVADTPGLRQFDLPDLSLEEIADCFPEFGPHLGTCRFDDCRHHSEPGCSIKSAVDAGTVHQRRYESFLQMTP